MAGKLDGYRILILETREEAQFSRLLQDQGADVIRCPMFTIEDTPDQDAVGAWIRSAISEPLDDLVLMTGEGVRRLVTAADRIGLKNEFIAALAKSRKYARGPKPGNALRQIGLTAEVVTQTPTTEGVIATLCESALQGRRVGLQLYPEKDHSALLATAREAGATPLPVEPYVYDTGAAQANITAAIAEIAAGRVDTIALTSSGQVRRLVEAARADGCEEQLRMGLALTPVASIGPVVSNELKIHGLQTDISPAEGAYFMKPLIQAITARLTQTPPRTAAQRL